MVIKLYELLINFVLALLAGVISACLVHYLEYRIFRKKERYQYQQEKRDALREILEKKQAMVCVLQTANAKRDKKEWQEKRDRLYSDLGRVIPFFVDDDETSNSLNRLLHLLRLENAHPDRKTISYEFDDYIQTLENKLIAINESLSGR